MKRVWLSAIKKGGNLFVATWTDIEGIMLREVSQRKDLKNQKPQHAHTKSRLAVARVEGAGGRGRRVRTQRQTDGQAAGVL